MIKEVRGNIFDHQGSILVHQVNCQNKINYGMAGQIIDRYPVVKDVYHATTSMYKNSKDLLGVVDLVYVGKGHNETFIANLYGQEHYGNSEKTGLVYTDINAVREGLMKIESSARKGNNSVKIPHGMSCGFAGEQWYRIYRIIREVFEDSPVLCTIYKK